MAQVLQYRCSQSTRRTLPSRNVLQGAHLAKGCCVPHVTCANRNLPLHVPAWQPHTVLPPKRGSETGVEPRRALASLNRHPSRAPLASSGWKEFGCRPWPTHTHHHNVRTSVLFTRCLRARQSTISCVMWTGQHTCLFSTHSLIRNKTLPCQACNTQKYVAIDLQSDTA